LGAAHGGAASLCFDGEWRWEEGGAGASEHERDDRLTRRGLHGDVRCHTDGGKGLLEQQARGCPGWADNERCAGKFPGAQRASISWCLWWQDELQFLLTEGLRDELAPPQGQVRGAELACAFAHERAHLVCALGFDDSNLHARMPGPEAADQTGHRVDGEGRQRGHLERARFQFQHAGYHVVHFLDGTLDLAGGTDERLTRGGQPQTSADSVKQFHAEF
jgi:hypothetical protein